MTEPTDPELWQFYMTLPGATPTSQPDPIEIMRATLAKWGTPPVAKWAPEEIADGERGIRWVTNEGIHGRPTDHDVREYLKRTPTAHGCHCDECKQFYTTPQPTQAQAGAVPQCWCLTCRPMRLEDPYSMRMALCPTCGNKRCPKANDHRNECNGSNEPGQPGSAYSGCIKGGQHER